MKHPARTKLSKPIPDGMPSRVFTLALHPDGILNRIHAMGYNIAILETKLEVSQLIEAEFLKYI